MGQNRASEANCVYFTQFMFERSFFWKKERNSTEVAILKAKRAILSALLMKFSLYNRLH